MRRPDAFPEKGLFMVIDGFRMKTGSLEEIEGVISNPSSDLVVGQQVRLKYHPKHKMNARIIR